MPKTKAAITRIQIIDQAIRNTGKRWPNHNDLVELISNKLDKPISRSSVEKDIAYMKANDAPLHFNTTRGGFEYTEIGYSFFNLPISESDMDAIRVAAETLRQYHHVPIFRQFQSAIIKMNEKLKLTDTLGEEIIEQTILFESAPAGKGVAYLSDLIAAIRNLQVVSFKYENIYKDKIQVYEIKPYLLKEYRNTWYLIGWSEDRKDYLTFGLDRISDLTLLRTVYKKRKDFDPKFFFKYSIGITEFDHQPQEIVLVFDAVIGKLIKNQPIHHTQTILADTSKGLKIGLKLLITEELLQMILSYGSHVTVEKPAILKYEVIARITAALKNY